MRLRRDFQVQIKRAACGLVAGALLATAQPFTASALADGPRAASGAGQRASELATRVATYQDASGTSFFAASLQPPADDALLQLLGDGPARLSIVVDTSASQVGPYRRDQVAAVRGILSALRPGDRVQLFAADVAASPLSEPIEATNESAINEALAKLSRRLPLGHTNLGVAMQTARASLVAGPREETRSMIYIGDGSSMELMADEQKFAVLVDALRADRIAVHSVAVGPTKNIALLATLANHTGGELAVVGEGQPEAAGQLGKQMAAAATLSPIWIDQMSLPEGLSTVQDGRLPPLRLDRDSLYLGTVTAGVQGGAVRITGKTQRGTVALAADLVVEENHPDFSFLPGMVGSAAENNGLLLPTAGSPLLREAARALAARADELAVAGEVARMTGSQRGAQAIAEMALQSDPDNVAARRLQQRAAEGGRLVVQNESDPFGEVFGNEPAPAQPAAPAPLPAPRTPVVQPGTVPPRAPRPEGAFAAPIGGDFLEPPSGLLDDVAAVRAQDLGRLRAEIRAQLLAARRQLETNPIGVSANLKNLLTRVENQPDIDPQARQELLGQIRSAIQSANRREAAAVEAEATAAQLAAAATQTELLLQETFRREEQLRTLSNQLNSLISEGRLRFADSEITPAIETLAKGTTFSNQALLETQMLNSATRMLDVRLRRERNYLDALALVEESNIPFVDDQPLKYPDADIWQRLSRRRLALYGSVDLVGDREAERRITAALGDEVTYSFIEETLENALRIIAEDRNIPILLDRKALEDTPFTPDTPVNLQLSNVTLRSFLRLMLREYELTYMINDEVLMITTPEMAEQNPKTKIYAVGDLVIPPIAGMMGMMGGMGGGMMGGMGGGMGGGMMGGMGGMGGGMGGMGGGMMGGMGGGMGMMAIPDDVSLATKSVATTPAPQPAHVGDAPQATAGPAEAPTATAPAATGAPGRIKLQSVSEPVSFDAWLQYFEGLQLEGPDEVTRHDQQVLATADYLNSQVRLAERDGNSAAARQGFAAVRDFLEAAILSGHVQPWMYHAYALSLRATGGDLADIERAYLSAVDFADSPEEVMLVAAHLQAAGCEAAALRLCQHLVALQPYRREALLLGLRLAEKLDDVDALQWACREILSQAWPKGSEKIEADARLLARATYQRLVQEGQKDLANQFLASLQEATSHDLVVRVSWTGQADIDVAVEEPSGTVCWVHSPLSTGGGAFLGDSFPGLESADDGGVLSETYICPQGYSGVYKILVRRVWGNVSSGHVTVDILSDVGRPSQKYIRQELELTEKDALIQVEVKEGTRKAEVGEAQLAHLRAGAERPQPKFLGQFAGGNDAAVMRQYLADLTNMGMLNSGVGGGLPGPFGPGRGVGFMPVITQLPQGATLMTLAVISADRRYVRVDPMPNFTQIGEVNTFNFVSGESGASPGGPGAGGGIGGGGIGGGGIGGGGIGGGGLGGGGLGGGGFGGGGIGN